MGVDFLESRRSRSVEKQDREDTPTRERQSVEHDESDRRRSDELRDSGKYRSKDKSRSSSRREEKDHKSRGRDKSKERDRENNDSTKDRSSGRDRRKEERDDREKDKVRDTVSEKDGKHKERKDRGKDRDRVRERGNELEKETEISRDKERGKEKSRDKEREKERDKGRDRGNDTVEKETGKERNREKEKQLDQEKDRVRDRDRSSRKQKDDSHDRMKDVEGEHQSKSKTEFSRDNQSSKEVTNNSVDEDDSSIQKNKETGNAGSHELPSKVEERVLRVREERLKKSSEGTSDVLAWVNKSRKLEDKRNAEKQKALQFSRILEEQDNINDEESDDEGRTTANLGGVKVLHGIDKVLEGGAVVLTLKDQSILADGDVNEEVDMLENVEIGEQKKRDDAYKAAKKKSGVYDDKFNDEPGFEKKMLPQYDDPVADEGLTLDSSGHFTGEAERKLAELRQRIQGISTVHYGENLNSTGKTSSDYFTQEEMMKFNKPKKKKKSLRKKDKLDLNALEAEALSAGLGVGDLGSRDNGRRQSLKEEQERIDAERRSNAFQSAYAKANEASKALQKDYVHTIKTEEHDTNASQSTYARADVASEALHLNAIKTEEDDTDVFGDDDDELRKSLERARKVALRKQDEEKTGIQTIALLAASTANTPVDNLNVGSADHQENKVVFTEMEEFVWGLQHDEETQKPGSEDVFMEEEPAPVIADEEMEDEDGEWSEAKANIEDEIPTEEEKEVFPDETIHEAAVGKGLGGVLKLLQNRGTLKETHNWGGRSMDKKKSKLVGIYENNGKKEIQIVRTDEYGRELTPKEAFRHLSHKFHGKGPGKTKQERYQRQYQEELKIKQMQNADTPSSSVARMRETQEKLQTPYLVLSGNVKHGQSSSGFTSVEKDFAGSLTPMLGDRKVEHFLNIKRKGEPKESPLKKKPRDGADN